MNRSKYQSWQRRELSELDRKMLALITEHWRAGHPIDRDSAEFELVQQGHPYQEVHQIISRFVDQTPVLLFDPRRPVPYLAGLVELGDRSSDEDLEKLAVLLKTLRKLYHPNRRQLSNEEASQHSGLPLEEVQRLAPLTRLTGEQGFHLSNDILGWETFDDFLNYQLPRPMRTEQLRDLPELQIDFIPSVLRWTNLGPYPVAELEISPVTVLVGANAAGKTSALRAIHWVKTLAQGGLDYVALPRTFLPSISSGFLRHGASTVEFSLGGELHKRGQPWTQVQWSVDLALRPPATVKREVFRMVGGPPEIALEQGIGFWPGRDGISEPLHLLTNQLALREADDPRRHAALIAIRQSLERWWAETSPIIDDDQLYQLLNNVEESDLCEEVKAVLGPVQVKRTGNGQWVFIDRRKHATALIHAPSGILQVVSLLARFHQPRRPTLLAFDEIENHLHADVVERLIDVMRSYTAHTRIVLTTHSGNVLRLMDPSEVRLVRAEDEGSSIVRIDQDPVLSQLAKNGDMAKLLEDGFFAGSL